MLNTMLGDTMMRITPPHDGQEGYVQYGVVSEVTDSTITIVVKTGVWWHRKRDHTHRHLEFSREDGMDTDGFGTFITKSPNRRHSRH